MVNVVEICIYEKQDTFIVHCPYIKIYCIGLLHPEHSRLIISNTIFVMITASNGKKKVSALLALCAGNSPVTSEFPAQRPMTRSFDVFSDLRLNKRLRKQSWGWWFEAPSCWLWRHCNISFFFFNVYTSAFLRTCSYTHRLSPCHQRPLLLNNWTLIPAWISNHIASKVWMKLLIHSQTSTVAPLKFGYIYVYKWPQMS